MPHPVRNEQSISWPQNNGSSAHTSKARKNGKVRPLCIHTRRITYFRTRIHERTFPSHAFTTEQDKLCANKLTQHILVSVIVQGRDGPTRAQPHACGMHGCGWAGIATYLQSTHANTRRQLGALRKDLECMLRKKNGERNTWNCAR